MTDHESHEDTPPTSEVAPQTWPAQPDAALAAPGSAVAGSAVAAAAPVASVPTSSNAVVALILAILSWAVCPIIASIVAIVFASLAATEINASQGRIGGRGLVTAARIIAWINIGITAAVILIGLLILIVVVLASSGTHWPTR